MTTFALTLALTVTFPTADPVKAVEGWVAREVPDARGLGSPDRIADERLTELFPKGAYVVFRVREYPISMRAPAPLAQRNVFFVDERDRVFHFPTREAFRRDFLARAPRVADREGAVRLAHAYLVVVREFSQDGFFRFRKPGAPKVTAKGSRFVVESDAAVEREGGDRGSVTAILTFERDGATMRLKEVEDRSDVQAGVRPICQSTLLLDDNPVVRRMAERDLLVIGSRALPYLRDAARRADPTLRREIDRVIARIERGER